MIRSNKIVFTFCLLAVASNVSAAQKRTEPAITQADLKTRLSIFADDSMLGRSTLNPGFDRAVRYLAAEATRLGLAPAGENGTYFQTFYIRERRLDRASTLVVGDTTLRPGPDFKVLVFGRGQSRPIHRAQVIYGGIVGDSTSQVAGDSTAGKVVLLGVPPTMNAARAYANVLYSAQSRFGGALAVVIASLEYLPLAQRGITSSVDLADTTEAPANSHPISILVSRRVANMLLGSDISSAIPGAHGRTVSGLLTIDEAIHPTRNVIATLRGSDPVVRGQYVALGAHSDHLGISTLPLEHDSVRAIASERRARLMGSSAGGGPVVVNTDSLRRIRAPRVDSIFNGADDDGSGSVALLEIAERFARTAERPRRSLLFVWHAAEEMGLEGSEWFTNHPTVPLDSIVAQINLDMIGRGGLGDTPAGGAAYLEVTGAKLRSPALQQIIDDINQKSANPFQIVTTDPARLFCRSDHWNYARFGIPVAFITTGQHADYHQVTDEARYIDYAKLEHVTRFVADVVLSIANTAQKLEPPGKRPPVAAFCAG